MKLLKLPLHDEADPNLYINPAQILCARKSSSVPGCTELWIVGGMNHFMIELSIPDFLTLLRNFESDT